MRLPSLIATCSLLLLSHAGSAELTPRRSPSPRLARRGLDFPVRLARREFPPYTQPYLITTEDFQLVPGNTYRINITTTVSVEEIAFLARVVDPVTGAEDYKEEMMMQAGAGEWLDEMFVDFPWPKDDAPDADLARTGHFGVTFSAPSARGAADVWEDELAVPSSWHGRSSGSEMERRTRRDMAGLSRR